MYKYIIMDRFPDEINRKTCMEVIRKNQLQLIMETREEFTKKIMKALNVCDRFVVLTFDDRLWNEHRVTITKELLERFGEFKTSTPQAEFTSTKITNSPSDIKENIKTIRIDFL